MRCLLDTHALIWWWLGDPSLSIGASDAMRSDSNRIFVSPVSAIEIGIKVRQGRLPVLRQPLAGIDDEMQRDGFEAIPISIHHARHAALLAGEHRDPFDRLIAAQALLEGMTVITRDQEIAQFGCETLW